MGFDPEQLRETTLEREQVWSGRIFSVEKRSVQLPGGHIVRRDVICHPGAVCVIPLTDAGEVLVERQWRSGYDGVTLEIPAGKLDGDGEEPLSAAQRELREETGATAAKWTYLGEYWGSPAILRERIHMYLAEELSFGQTDYDEDEIMAVERVPLPELVEQVLAGTIPDGKTQCAVLRAAMMRGANRA
jgi:ADP-ribose pyrophosphatase